MALPLPARAAALGGVISGSGGLTLSGPGGLALTAANTYSGGTTISAGRLLLDFSAGGAANNILPGGNVVFSGGTLELKGSGAAANTQTLGNATFNPGAAAITLTPNGAAALTLTIGAWGRAAGATVNLTLGAGTLTANPAPVNGVIPYATVAGGDFATTSGGNVAAYSAYTAGLPTSGASATVNYSHTGAASVNASEAVNTLKLTANSAGQSLTVAAGAALTVAGNGLLLVGGNDYTITGGSLTAGNGVGSYELIAQQYGSGNVTIASTVADNGANPVVLTKSGPGQLTLTAANTYAGGTIVSQGTLALAPLDGAATPLGSGPVTLAGGVLSFLNFSQTYGNAVSVAGDSTVDVETGQAQMGALSVGGNQLSMTGGSGTQLTFGATTLSGTATFNPAAGTTLSVGAVGGIGGILKTGAGTMVLAGGSSFAGGAAVNEGVLAVSGGGAALGPGPVTLSGGVLSLQSACASLQQ